VTLINWLLKSKCMLHIFWIFPLMYEDTIFIFIFERLGRMHENKTFYFYIFIFVFMKTRYFNTGFVSLQYKNTNQYWSKYSKIYEKITNFFWTYFLNLLLFFYLFFWAGSSSARVAGLDPAVLSGSLAQPSDPAA